jgi:uncharacterized membrane protein YphA (DoxX/SURF4 family)
MTSVPETHISPWRARLIALLRIVFGLTWAIAAWLKWQPAFINTFMDQVTGASDGQPPMVKYWILWWGSMISTNPQLYAYLLASLETTIAALFIFGILTNLTSVVSILLSFGIWSVAEGFGGPLQPGKSTDIGPGIMYTIISGLLLAIAAGRYYAVDQWLTPRLGRFGFLAAGPFNWSQKQ